MKTLMPLNEIKENFRVMDDWIFIIDTVNINHETGEILETMTRKFHRDPDYMNAKTGAELRTNMYDAGVSYWLIDLKTGLPMSVNIESITGMKMWKTVKTHFRNIRPPYFFEKFLHPSQRLPSQNGPAGEKRDA